MRRLLDVVQSFPGHTRRSFMARSVLVLGGAIVLSLCAGGSSQARADNGAVLFASHQALYTLSLKSSRGNTAISNAKGRILYSFSGNACEGFTSDFHQIAELDAAENATITSDLRSNTWESADSTTYRFRIETRTNDEEPTLVDGMAERSGDGITVTLKQPVEKTLTIDADTVFPTEQIRRIIAAARDGKSMLQLKVYDGSDGGEKVYDTFAVIGQPIDTAAAKKSDTSPAPDAALSAVKRWPVTVSYYDRSAKTGGEQTPVYAMSFELYENGVSRALVLDYNDFVVDGAMSKFDIKTLKPCKP